MGGVFGNETHSIQGVSLVPTACRRHCRKGGAHRGHSLPCHNLPAVVQKEKANPCWLFFLFLFRSFWVANSRPHTVRRWIVYSACQSDSAWQSGSSRPPLPWCRQSDSAWRCGSWLQAVEVEKTSLWLLFVVVVQFYTFFNKKAYKRIFEPLRL